MTIAAGRMNGPSATTFTAMTLAAIRALVKSAAMVRNVQLGRFSTGGRVYAVVVDSVLEVEPASPVGGVSRSTVIVQLPISAASAPSAASCGARRAPPSPRASGD